MTTRSVIVTTAAEALRDEEVDRTRDFIQLGWLIAIGSIGAAFGLPGDPELRRVLVIAVAATALGSVLVHRRLRSTAALRSPMMVMLAVACVGCGELALLYTGNFAGAPLMISLGIYFFCRTESRATAIAIYGLAAVAHAVLLGLVLGGVLDDFGIAPPGPQVSVQAQLAGHGCAQLCYAIAFWLARSTRAASLRSIEELQRATRIAAMRLAQLDEARDDLDRALKIGGPGQFTGAVVGSWELGTVLGRGGMGEVYEATHVDTAALAAVKLLRRELMSDRMHVERFLREVRAAGELQSPHVVRVIEASGPEQPVPFLAMERLRGDTLSALLRGAGTLDRVLIVELVTQVAAVLELARASSIVHRDIKPPNIFRTQDGTWKLLDFGVAILADTSGTLTAGGVIGTPGYMAPEQAKGEAVDHRADGYALGAVVYRCLTGRPPFGGPDPAAVMYAMVHDMPIRPGALSHAERDVERVLAIALAKRRSDRFQSAGDLAVALTAAFKSELAPKLRTAADALLRNQPWREVDTSPTRQL